MISTNLIVWAVFICVFGGAALKWWIGGGYKIYLKYKSDYQKQKDSLERKIKEKEAKEKKE